MIEGYKFADGAYYDERLIPIKFIVSTYGSEETFALFASPKRKWRRESEFIAALKLFGETDEEETDTSSSNPIEHFLYLLIYFNEFMPEQVTINPAPQNNRKVLEDTWRCKSIMWEENKCYFAYLWMTTA